jgi:hypothetical protein
MQFGNIMPWMKHLLACCDVMRQAFEIANKIGDLTMQPCTAQPDTLLIAAGDSLVEVQSEAESSLDFAQKAKFGFAA